MGRMLNRLSILLGWKHKEMSEDFVDEKGDFFYISMFFH
jgi:hypothetical protein